MNNPGNWILGEPTDLVRNAGLGILVEYANQHKQPQWIKPSTLLWDYTQFGNKAAATPSTAQNIDMVFEKVPRGTGHVQHLYYQR